MKTKNSYNTKYNTLWHNVGWGWKLVGRKDQMNRNLKKERVTWYLCYYVSTTVLYIYMLVILPNVWYRCIYIYILGKVKTHTRVRADTHNILYACTSPELHTYKYGDISSKTVVILPYFVHMHVSFQAKEVDAPKGEEQVFFMTQQGQH